MARARAFLWTAAKRQAHGCNAWVARARQDRPRTQPAQVVATAYPCTSEWHDCARVPGDCSKATGAWLQRRAWAGAS
eukprot:1339913-Lingulodinium_polyedra.AAC.1